MKKLFSFILALTMIFSITTTAFASGEEIPKSEPQLDTIFELADNVTVEPQSDAFSTISSSTVVTGTITDASKIRTLVNGGVVECDSDGGIPTKIVVTQIIDNTSLEGTPDSMYSTQSNSSISITKKDYYDGQYFEEYDRYVIDGPSEFTETYSRTSTVGWNATLSASTEVGGKVYNLADVKAAVSTSMGYSIGESLTKTSTYKVNIPAKKLWEIKVWTSYRVFTYTAKVGSVQIATGKSWYPNGLVILHAERNS